MDASTAINSVQTQTETMRASMTELEEQADKIGTVLNVITTSPIKPTCWPLMPLLKPPRRRRRTRIAVVADEVRKLAEKQLKPRRKLRL